MKNRSFTLAVLLLTVAAAGLAQTGSGAGRLLVDDVSGAVKIRMDERWQTPSKGMTLTLPSIVSTGADGAAEIAQDDTRVSIAENSAIEFYGGAEPSQALQRVVQDRGSAFYDIAPRSSNKLRVETAYLVAVIKGTQFDVTADGDATTIALFEGRLQIEAPGIAEVVDLAEGQIASRRRGEAYITVIDMQSGNQIAGAIDASRGGSDGAPDSTLKRVSGTPAADVDANVGGKAGPASLTLNGKADLDPAETEVALGAGLELGGIAAETGLEVEIGAGEVGAGAGIGAELGIAGEEIDIGVDAGLDVDNVALELDAGPVGIDVGLDLDPVGELGDTLLDETLPEPGVVETVTEEVLPGLSELLGT